MHFAPRTGHPTTTSQGGRKVKSETPAVVDALDAATRSTGGVGLLVDTFPDDTRAAILRAVARRVSNREIAHILTVNGYRCSEAAVRLWVQRNG